MKKLLYLLALVFALSSCSSAYFVQKSEDFKQKAIDKGAVYESDTLYKYIIESDTVWETIDGLTVPVITYRVDSIPYEVERLVYVPMSGRERRAYKDSLKNQAKMYALETKRLNKEAKRTDKANKTANKKLKIENKALKIKSKAEIKIARAENRGWGWRWLMFFLGAAAMFVIRMLIKRFIVPLKIFDAVKPHD